jgi:hypothetical protein
MLNSLCQSSSSPACPHVIAVCWPPIVSCRGWPCLTPCFEATSRTTLSLMDHSSVSSRRQISHHSTHSIRHVVIKAVLGRSRVAVRVTDCLFGLCRKYSLTLLRTAKMSCVSIRLTLQGSTQPRYLGWCFAKFQVSSHLIISGFLALLTIGGGPSVSGYGSRGVPFGLPIAAGRNGIAVSGPLIGVFGGLGGATVGGEDALYSCSMLALSGSSADNR